MPTQHQGKTILIVEDNPYNMKLAVDLLELAGFTVNKAVDGQSALSILEKNPPHLILLDLRLPDIHGLEVFKKIKENKELDAIKIVAFTASTMKSEDERIRDMGFDAFISKPIDTVRFIQEIERLL